jgi:MFS family permease
MEGKQAAAGSGKRFFGIPIPADLKWSHFFSLYAASFFIACLMVIPAIVQPLLLKQVIKIPSDLAGTINSGLQNMSQIATLLFVGLIGILSDKVGRRILAVLGFLICGVFFILFGHSKDISLALGITSVGGQVFIAYIIRFIIGIGIILSFPQTFTILGDYTAPSDRGKAMAWHGAMMALGSIIVFGVLARFAGKMGLMSLFYMAGALGFFGLIISRLGLVDRLPEQKAKKLGVKEIYREVSKSITLKASYVVTGVVRADIIVKSVFLFVWLLEMAKLQGVTPMRAMAMGGKVMLVGAIVTLIAYPFIGILLDRWGRVPVTVGGTFTTGAAFCLIAATQNPFSPVLYLYICMISIGFSAASLGATTMAIDVSPRPLLGSIMGGLNTMQPIGVLFFLQLGGYLFDKVGYWTPWALKGGATLILGIWLLMIMGRIKTEVEEAAPIRSLTFTMAWEDEAKDRLEKVPAPFREAAVSGTEEYARKNSHEKVTAAVMEAYRKELGM